MGPTSSGRDDLINVSSGDVKMPEAVLLDTTLTQRLMLHACLSSIPLQFLRYGPEGRVGDHESAADSCRRSGCPDWAR